MARRKRNRNKKRQNEPQYFAPDGTPLAPANTRDHQIVWSDQDSYDDDDSKPERGTEILDELMIDNGSIPGITKKDFVDAGFTCPDCDWSTKKKGLSGLQALRGHSKRHVRDRRATRDSNILHIVVLLSGLLIGLIPEFFPALLPNAWLSLRGQHIPIATDLLGKSVAVISVIVTVIILFISDKYISTGRRRWSHAYRQFERIWITCFIFVAALRWTDIGQEVEIPWMILVFMPWVASVFVRVRVANTRIAVSRREFKPRHQIKLFRSRIYSTDLKIRGHANKLKQRIQDGRIQLSELSHGQLNYYRRLGLGGTRLDKRLEARRLSKEGYAKRAKAREIAAAERKQQRQRVSRPLRTKRSRDPNQKTPHSKRKPAER